MRRLFALTILALATTVAAPRVARACGDHGAVQAPTRDELARAVVEAHFTALAGGDAEGVARLWSKKAKVTSVAADGTRTTRPLKQALKRWLAHREGLTWQIGAIDVRDDGRVIVRIAVTWNGAGYNDVLTLRDVGGELRITGKASSAVVARSSAYG